MKTDSASPVEDNSPHSRRIAATVPKGAPFHVKMNARRHTTKRERRADVVILGAGLAGTSLAHHLKQGGFQDTIALLDSRLNFAREQRWCTWSEVPPSMSGLVSHSWSSWQVRNGEKTARRESNKHAYREIYAPHFFHRLHQGWRQSGQIQLRTGQKIEGVFATGNQMRIETADASWRAGQVFDSRFHSELDDASLGIKNSAHMVLAQTFVGRVVEFERAVFDASCATLMDFNLPQSPNSGVSFAYVLPYDAHRALIETTNFAVGPMPRHTHENLLNSYLAQNFPGAHRVVSQESGFVPMTTATSSTRSVENWHRIGVLGGQARASSGYAFGRIQRATTQIARQIVSGQSVSIAVAPAKYAFLDEVFLDALNSSPRFAANCFTRLFDRVPTDTLVRFLDDRSSLLDDARLIAALPKAPFLAAAARRANAHLPAC